MKKVENFTKKVLHFSHHSANIMDMDTLTVERCIEGKQWFAYCGAFAG